MPPRAYLSWSSGQDAACALCEAWALGLPLLEIPLPHPCGNAEYQARMAAANARLRAQGVERVVFGDLFLEDIRAYRQEKLAVCGRKALFPLWGRPTRALAEEMLAAGMEAHVVCLDPKKLERRFAGRRWDRNLLAELPAGVDPCGENGEFHTCVTAGLMFAAPIVSPAKWPSAKVLCSRTCSRRLDCGVRVAQLGLPLERT